MSTKKRRFYELWFENMIISTRTISVFYDIKKEKTNLK